MSAEGIAVAAGTFLATYGVSRIALKSLAVRGKNKSAAIQKKLSKMDAEDRRLLLSVLFGTLLMAGLAWGSQWMPIAASVGGAIGYLVYRLFIQIWFESAMQAKRREISLLFETVEFYLRAGMSLYYALSSARLVAPRLSKAVGACLVLWPSGSAKALERLKEEINLPEAEILASLLTQIDRVGFYNLQGVIQKESQNLERLREAHLKAKITSRPIFFVVYRLLPLLAVFGMFAGTLYWRLNKTLGSVGIGF